MGPTTPPPFIFPTSPSFLHKHQPSLSHPPAFTAIAASAAMFQSSPSVYDEIAYASFDARSVRFHDPTPSLLSSYFLHRTSSSHSLSPPAGLPDPCDYHGFPLDPLRRVFSAGELQCINGSSAAGEASHPDPAGRIGRYSAEERRERIERYRSKRNHRNFQKKITYACRKTLADSRPRVRGRFARNGEAEAETETAEGGFGHWNTCGGGGDFWGKMQAALETAEEEEESGGGGGYDEDLWASFDGVFTMNLS